MWVFKSRVLEKKRRTLVTEKGGGWTDRVICKAARKMKWVTATTFLKCSIERTVRNEFTIFGLCDLKMEKRTLQILYGY